MAVATLQHPKWGLQKGAKTTINRGFFVSKTDRSEENGVRAAK